MLGARLLGIDPDGITAESPRVFETKNGLMVLGAPDAKTAGHGHVLAIHGQAEPLRTSAIRVPHLEQVSSAPDHTRSFHAPLEAGGLVGR